MTMNQQVQKENNSTELFPYLRSGMGAAEVKTVVKHWIEQPSLAKNFLDNYNQLKDIQKKKGFWVLSHMAQAGAKHLEEFQDPIFEIFKSTTERSIRRETFCIFFHTNVSEEIEGHMVEKAFLVLTDPDAAVAERHHGLQWLFRAAMQYSDLIPEIMDCLERGKMALTPSWKKYSEKLIQELSNGKVRKV